jgi:hypothetical protein
VSDEELRALDARIHREVMGATCYQRPETGEWCEVYDWMRDFNGNPIPVGIPEYSSSWHALGILAERLRAWWGCFNLCAGLEWHCYSTSSNAVPPEGSGETPMLAVCRAAIKVAEENPSFVQMNAGTPVLVSPG